MLVGRMWEGSLGATALRRFRPPCRPTAAAGGGHVLLGSARTLSVKPTTLWQSKKGEPLGSVAAEPSRTSGAQTTREVLPTTLTASDFAALAPMVLLQSALQQHTLLANSAYADAHEAGVNRVVISRATFDNFCALSHVPDTQAALDALHDAAIVVALDGGARVHLRPAQYLEELAIVEALHAAHISAASPESERSSMVLPPPLVLEAVEQRIAALEAKEQAMRARLAPAIARAARWRRSVWGGALLYAGAQLAVIARLTYFDLDWDIMEPVSYCLGIGATLLFFVYYLVHDVEHTYTDVDRRYLPKRVRKYAPADFDWHAYNELCQQLADERAMRERLRAWAKEH